MTTFQDGPAKGQTFMLRRAPVFLRVTEAVGKFDALDQPDDTPEPHETLHCYVLAEKPRSVHLCVRGKNRGAGGFYPMATYKLVENPPTDASMRAQWRVYTDQQGMPDWLV